MSRIVAVLILFLFGGGPALAQEYHEHREEKHPGKFGTTFVNGWLDITKVKDEYKIHCKIEVRYEGRMGVGKGRVLFVLLDANNQPTMIVASREATVGADTIKGKAKKDSEVNINIFANKFEQTNGYAMFIETENSAGFPNSVADIKKFLKDDVKEWKEIAESLKPGQKKDLSFTTGKEKAGAGLVMKRFK